MRLLYADVISAEDTNVDVVVAARTEIEVSSETEDDMKMTMEDDKNAAAAYKKRTGILTAEEEVGVVGKLPAWKVGGKADAKVTGRAEMGGVDVDETGMTAKERDFMADLQVDVGETKNEEAGRTVKEA